MTTGTIHQLADHLFVIEGHHPHSLWEDPDIPSIVVYGRGTRLYLLDTGVGEEQRTDAAQGHVACLRLFRRRHGPLTAGPAAVTGFSECARGLQKGSSILSGWTRARSAGREDCY